ncbi:MAG: hypothetical protein QME21_04255 [Anaerolineales bacterium]|nr:hypothetical protein [Anaerolineales bacterium]
MNIYSIVLFLHITGALGFFVTLGLEWTVLRQIRNATTSEQVRAWMSLSNGTRRLGMVSMLTIVIAGFYLMAAAWGGVAWLIVALGAVVLLMALLYTLTRPRMAAIGRAMTAEKGPVSYTLQNLANDPLLWISIQTRVAIALGIVFLMTVKPGLGGSLLTIGIAIVLSLALSLPMMRRKRVQERPAD